MKSRIQIGLISLVVLIGLAVGWTARTGFGFASSEPGVGAHIGDAHELANAYQARQKTAQALVAHAYRHDIPVDSALVVALDESSPDLKVEDQAERQGTIGARTRDLIAQLDEQLDADDTDFSKLYQEFEAEESNLNKAAQSYFLARGPKK